LLLEANLASFKSWGMADSDIARSLSEQLETMRKASEDKRTSAMEPWQRAQEARRKLGVEERKLHAAQQAITKANEDIAKLQATIKAKQEEVDASKEEVSRLKDEAEMHQAEADEGDEDEDGDRATGVDIGITDELRAAEPELAKEEQELRQRWAALRKAAKEKKQQARGPPEEEKTDPDGMQGIQAGGSGEPNKAEPPPAVLDPPRGQKVVRPSVWMQEDEVHQLLSAFGQELTTENVNKALDHLDRHADAVVGDRAKKLKLG